MSRIVIITGSSGALGSVTVKFFLSKGYKVISIVSPKKAGRLSSSEGVEEIPLDLTNEKEVEDCIDKINLKYPQIDAVLMLAGGFAMGGLEATTGTDLQKMYSLNFETAYYISRFAFQKMSKQAKGGRLIFIGSKPALEPQEGKGKLAYSLSKSLLIQLSEHINQEGKSKDIISYVVAPSIIDTPENRNSMPNSNFDNWVKPEEIAEIMEFLCSDTGSKIRDTIVKVYGNA